MRRLWRGALLLITGLNTLVLGPAVACAAMLPADGTEAAATVHTGHEHHAPASDESDAPLPDHSATCALAAGCLVAVTPRLNVKAGPHRGLERVVPAGPAAERAQPSRAPEPPPPRG